MDGARVGTAFLDIKGDFSSVNKEVASFAGKLGKVGKLAGGLGVVAAGAAAAGKALYDIGSEFDQAYDTIQTGTGKTGKQLRKLKKDFKAVVVSVPTDFGSAGEAVSELNKRLGISGKPLRTLSKEVLELSRITGTDLNENIAASSRLFEDWQIKTKKQPAALDKLFRASQKTGIGVGKLAEYMVQFGSPLRQLGFNFDTAAAMFSKFEQEGVNLQTLMPGLRMALKNLANPTDELAGKLSDLGIKAKEPDEKLREVIKTIEGMKTVGGATDIASQVFGGRAWSDAAAAIQEGRFKFGDLIKTMEHGKGTILGTAKSTRDFDENMQLLGNRLKVLLAPAARLVFNAVGSLSAALAKVDFKKLANELGLTKKTFHDVSDAASDLWKVIGPIASTYLKAAIIVFKTWAGEIKGIAEIISGILHGDFSKVWQGIKDLFSAGVKGALGILKTMTGPVRGILGDVADAMGKGLGAAWDGVTDLFRDGVNEVIGFLNTLIGAITSIPGVPDIGPIGEIGGGDGAKKENKRATGYGTTGQHRTHKKQRGGPIDLGAPSGDSVPAMLERGEYVLNREAVASIGKRHLDAINFDHAPRYAFGSFIGGAGDIVKGGLEGTAESLTGGAFGIGKDVAGKGASYFIDHLPKPHISGLLGDVGSYVIGKVTDYIKHGFQSGKLGEPKPTAQGQYGMHALEGLWDYVHGPKTVDHEAAAIAMAESEGKPKARNKSGASGLWQILGQLVPGNIFDPVVNAKNAVAKYRTAPGGGNNFSPWVTYTSGAYKAYMASGGMVELAKSLRAKGLRDLPDRSAPPAELEAWNLMARGGVVTAAEGGLIGTLMARAKELKGIPYPHPDQHFGLQAHPSFLDCSAAVSDVLHSGGLLDREMVSGELEGWGKSGAGNLMTVYANAGHAWMELMGHPWGTSVGDGGSGGLGFHPDPGSGYKGEFTARHSDAVEKGGGGGTGLTKGQQTKAEAEARKKQREARLKKLRGLVGAAKTNPAKQSSLWRLLEFWGRVGMFDKGERSHFLDSVQGAAASMTIDGRVGILSDLASFASNHGEITGRDPDNWHSLTDAIGKAKERGENQRQDTVEKRKRQKDRKKAKIEGKGQFKGLAKMLLGKEGNYNLANQAAERLVALEPEDLTDAYVGGERDSWGGVLGTLSDWRDSTVYARNTASSMKEVFEGEIKTIKELSGKAFQKQKWKIPALRGAIANATEFIGARTDDMQGFQGYGGPQTMLGPLGEGTPWWLTLGGPGAQVFDTQNTIRELGLKGAGNEAAASGPTPHEEFLTEQLRFANQREAVSEAQKVALEGWDAMRKGFSGFYAQGGSIPAGMWGIAGERGPEPVFGPATVTSNDDFRGMTSAGGVQVIVNGDIVQRPGDTRPAIEVRDRKGDLVKDVLEATGVGPRHPGSISVRP